MKKLPLLALSLTFVAASCNSLIFGGSGNMGVLKSEDLGQNFAEANSIDRKTNLNSTSSNVLVFDPQNAQILYLGSAGGLYKTENSGGVWKLLVTNILITDVAVHPAASTTVYAVGVSNNHGKVVKTTDGGGSWKDLYTEPTNGNAVVSIAVDPANPNRVIAALESGEIIHSLDEGSTWQVITDLQNQIYRIRFGPNRNAYVLTHNRGLYTSRDGGKTFVNLTGSLSGSFVTLNSEFSAVTRFLDMSFDQKQVGVMYLATDTGLVRTVNDGTNWSFMKMPVKNSVLRTSAVAVNPQDSNNIYSTIGNTLFVSSNGGITWETRPLSTSREVREILIDSTSPNVVYLSLGARK